MNLICWNMAPSTRTTRKWEVFAGRNKFYCDGYLMSAPNTGVFYLTVFLITGTSVLFFAFDCPYLATRITIAIPIIGAFLYFFAMASLLRTTFTDPGIIPRASHDEAAYIEKQIEVPNSLNSPTHRPPPRTKEVLVKGQTVKLKYCFTCKIFRPPRASHCSLCDNCVDRFDHHCPWVGNCVGKRNYRFFYMFIVSLAFLAVFIFSCSVTHIVLLAKDDDKEFVDVLKRAPFSVIITFVCFFSIWSVIGLAGFHTYLTTSDQTTNEDIKGSFTAKGAQKTINPYSHGNICFNCFYIICGPMTPSLIDRRGQVTDDYRIQMQPCESIRYPNTMQAPPLLTQQQQQQQQSGYSSGSADQLNKPKFFDIELDPNLANTGIYRGRSYDNLQNGNSNSAANLVENEMPLSNINSPTSIENMHIICTESINNNIDNIHHIYGIGNHDDDNDDDDDARNAIIHGNGNDIDGSGSGRQGGPGPGPGSSIIGNNNEIVIDQNGYDDDDDDGAYYDKGLVNSVNSINSGIDDFILDDGCIDSGFSPDDDQLIDKFNNLNGSYSNLYREKSDQSQTKQSNHLHRKNIDEDDDDEDEDDDDDDDEGDADVGEVEKCKNVNNEILPANVDAGVDECNIDVLKLENVYSNIQQQQQHLQQQNQINVNVNHNHNNNNNNNDYNTNSKSSSNSSSNKSVCSNNTITTTTNNFNLNHVYSNIDDDDDDDDVDDEKLNRKSMYDDLDLDDPVIVTDVFDSKSINHKKNNDNLSNKMLKQRTTIINNNNNDVDSMQMQKKISGELKTSIEMKNIPQQPAAAAAAATLPTTNKSINSNNNNNNNLPNELNNSNSNNTNNNNNSRNINSGNNSFISPRHRKLLHDTTMIDTALDLDSLEDGLCIKTNTIHMNLMSTKSTSLQLPVGASTPSQPQIPLSRPPPLPTTQIN